MPGMSEERLFPLLFERGATPHAMKIPWSVAEKAYCVYVSRYGPGQSLQRLAERGGFGHREMDDLYPPWRDETSEIHALRERLAAAEQDLERERPFIAAYREARDRIRALEEERDHLLTLIWPGETLDRLRERIRAAIAPTPRQEEA